MTVTLVKMGRRKQNCPQKSGNNSSNSFQGNNNSTTTSNNNNNIHPDEGSEEPSSMQEDNADSLSATSDSGQTSLEASHHRIRTTSNGNEPFGNNSSTMEDTTQCSLEAGMAGRSGTPSSSIPSSSILTSSVSNASTSDPLSLFKNPLFNPALLSLNPSLYAVQLAHLQAAQLLSQASSTSGSSLDESFSRKRKMGGGGGEYESLGRLSTKRPMSPKESPLDLTKEPSLASKGSFSPGKLDPFTAAAALSPFFSPFLAGGAGRPDMLLPGVPESNHSFVKNNISNPLERMSEIVKGPGGLSSSSSANHSSTSGGSSTTTKSTGPRHSAWQSQWINRGPENSKDIFKCVWCKDAFSSLQDLTDHMKETKHFGPQIPSPPSSVSPRGSTAVSKPHPTPPPPPPPPIATTSSSIPSSPKSRDILKEQLPMPRKLVRGQDVWLGRGEQQTRDILKCMWCGQSFRSLDLMTKHMQETKHYTKVISQEQLSSWKAGGGNSTTPEAAPPHTPPSPASASASQHSSHVNSVLTCKVCEVSFSTLRDLSDHMVQNNHHFGEGKGSPQVTSPPPPSVPPKEKRKKSLPVRKLLELERAQQELIISGIKSEEGRITCEKCSEKIPVSLFASHIHLCVGSSSEQGRRPPSSSAASSSTPPSISPPSHKASESVENERQPKSILGSLEKMVQGNFGAGSKKKASLPPSGGGETSLSILQRLGIDESSDFSRPASNLESPQFRPFPNFYMGSKFGASSSRSDSSECSSPEDRSKHSAFPEAAKDEEMKVEESSSLIKNSPLPPSPAPSQRSFQELSHREEEAGTPNSLVDKQMEEEASEDQGRKKNPLAALQLLCDKTEKPKVGGASPHGHNNNGQPPASSSPSSLLPPYSDPGAILAFSWACNQAIVNDSLLKCPFCDTPFISKGAYRHHLSKVHFVKDDKGLLPSFPGAGTGLHRAPEKSPPNENNSERSPSAQHNPPASTPPSGASPSASSSSSAKAENAQSKFQKYSQLAKQLSCSSQP